MASPGLRPRALALGTALAFAIPLGACGQTRPVPDEAQVYVQVEPGWKKSRLAADGFTADQLALDDTTHVLGVVISFLFDQRHQDHRGRDIVLNDDLADTAAGLRDNADPAPGTQGESWANCRFRRDATGTIHLTIVTRPDVPYHDTVTVTIPCPESCGNALILSAEGHVRFNGETLPQP